MKSKKIVKIFPCNFPQKLLDSTGVAYSRDLLTDEYYVENPPKHLLDFLTTLIFDKFEDKEFHDFDNKDGITFPVLI